MSQNKLHQKCFNAIYDLEKKIASKITNLQEQKLACHQTISSFLKIQIWNPDYTYEKTTTQVAKYYGYGFYIFKKIAT